MTVKRFSAPGAYTNEVVDALGQATQVERDERGQVLSMTDPLDGRCDTRTTRAATWLSRWTPRAT